MPRDDSTTEVALMATGAATLSHLQTMRHSMAAVFAEEPVLGSSGVGIEEFDPDLWDLGFEGDKEPTLSKCTSGACPAHDPTIRGLFRLGSYVGQSESPYTSRISFLL